MLAKYLNPVTQPTNTPRAKVRTLQLLVHCVITTSFYELTHTANITFFDVILRMRIPHALPTQIGTQLRYILLNATCSIITTVKHRKAKLCKLIHKLRKVTPHTVLPPRRRSTKMHNRHRQASQPLRLPHRNVDLMSRIPRKRKRKRATKLIKGKWRFLKRFLLRRLRRRGRSPYKSYRLRLLNKTYLRAHHHHMRYAYWLRTKSSQLYKSWQKRLRTRRRRLIYSKLPRICTAIQQRSRRAPKGKLHLRHRRVFKSPKLLHAKRPWFARSIIIRYKTRRRKSLRFFKKHYNEFVIQKIRTNHISWRLPPGSSAHKKLYKVRRIFYMYYAFIKHKKIIHQVKNFFKISRQQFVRKMKFKLRRQMFRKFTCWRSTPRRLRFFKFRSTPVRYNHRRLLQPHICSDRNNSYVLYGHAENLSYKGKSFTSAPRTTSRVAWMFFQRMRYHFDTHSVTRKLISHNGRLHKSPKIVSAKTVKKRIFRALFEDNMSRAVYSNRALSYVANTFTSLRFKVFPKRKHRNITHKSALKLRTDVQRIITNPFNTKTTSPKTTSPFIVATQTAPTPSNKNAVTNFVPLVFFLRGRRLFQQKQTNAFKHTLLRSYHLNVNPLHTIGFKTFFLFFALTFLENFTQQKTWIRVTTNYKIPERYQNYMIFFSRKHRGIIKRAAKFVSMVDILEIFIMVFVTHDLNIFLTYIRRLLEKNHFKRHKRILSIIFDVLRKSKNAFLRGGVRGFSFDIRGKVGVSGNAKKRHVFFSFGKITTTSQHCGSYMQQTNVWTPTGQMGITCVIQY